jgi:hypothetical protein
VAIRYGEPVAVPPDADPEAIEEHRLMVEERLKAITDINDQEVS